MRTTEPLGKGNLLNYFYVNCFVNDSVEKCYINTMIMNAGPSMRTTGTAASMH